MKSANSTPQPVKITAMTVADAAKAMSSAYGRLITEDQVRLVAERGGLVKPDGTFNLLNYAAYLIREKAIG